MKRILMTGATGVLGSELAYHLIYEKLVEKVPLEINLVVRPDKQQSGKERIKELFDTAIMPSKLTQFSADELIESVHILEGDLESFAYDSDERFTLIHSAATVNLNNKAKTKDIIINNNYLATLALVHRFKGQIEHMVFVSTAYACGEMHGQVSNDYLGMDQDSLKFRNYYEEYKYKAEQEVNALADRYGFKLSIVRPSIISGRLIVEPKYVMQRYIVYYLMGKFFREMAKMGVDKNERIRLQAGFDTKLNIVAVDYVAKGIVRILRRPDINQLNLVSSIPFPVKHIVSKALTINGFTNFEYVDEEPENQTKIENFFYTTVAKQLVQYARASHHTFDTTELRELLHDVPEPDLEEQFDRSFEFAHYRDYKN